MTSLQWHQATSIEVRFRGHKGDQAQQGSVIVRTRDDASGTRSGVGAGGGAVALMVELLSVYPTMPESAGLTIAELYSYHTRITICSSSGIPGTYIRVRIQNAALHCNTAADLSCREHAGGVEADHQ